MIQRARNTWYDAATSPSTLCPDSCSIMLHDYDGFEFSEALVPQNDVLRPIASNIQTAVMTE